MTTKAFGRRFDETYEIALRRAIHKGHFEIPVTSATEARNLRSYFYHYRRWLKQTSHVLAPKAAEVRFIIEPHALVLSTEVPGTSALRQAVIEDSKQ